MNWSRKIRDKGRSSRAAGATTAHIGRDARRAEGARSHGIPEFGRFGKQMTDDFVLQINPRKEYRLYDALRSFPAGTRQIILGESGKPNPRLLRGRRRHSTGRVGQL